MNDKQQVFDFDAFNAELQKSTNICSGARADIERAIAAGKGTKAQPELAKGQIYRWGTGKRLRVIVHDGTQLISVGLNGEYGDSNPAPLISSGAYKFVANSLQEYLAAGGTI